MVMIKQQQRAELPELEEYEIILTEDDMKEIVERVLERLWSELYGITKGIKSESTDRL